MKVTIILDDGDFEINAPGLTKEVTTQLLERALADIKSRKDITSDFSEALFEAQLNLQVMGLSEHAKQQIVSLTRDKRDALLTIATLSKKLPIYFEDYEGVQWKLCEEGLYYKYAGGMYKLPEGDYTVVGPVKLKRSDE